MKTTSPALRPGVPLAALLLTLLPACGRDTTPAPSSGTPSAAGIRWIDGFEAGAARAASPDELLFVYVGRHHPT